MEKSENFLKALNAVSGVMRTYKVTSTVKKTATAAFVVYALVRTAVAVYGAFSE